MTIPTPPFPRPRVLAVVLVRGGDDIAGVLRSIETQVYEPDDVVVVTHRPLGPPAEATSPRRVETMAQALAMTETEVEYLWILDSRTTARPDALAALVSTADQVEASVVGSKILDVGNPEQLLSVGGATDVFGFPYTGLDRGELDQEQFDVIRDVAYVEPASMLVRRDLAEGLGGLDRKLPYIASGLDLCQRARVVGGRVVVAPTSEVFTRASGEDRVYTWREQAGRLRVMLKTYSGVTLLWSVPGLFLLGLVTGLYRAARGSFRAPADWLRTWLWNALHLPSTMVARRRARAISMAVDTELFRFQVKGSVELRAVASELGALLGSDTDSDEDYRIHDSSPASWQRPAMVAAVLGVGFVLALTRSILVEGLPATGFVLPLADSAWNTLRAYAGGWHLGGLGSPEPMHPSVGATAAVQLLLGNRAALAATLLTVGSAASGLVGTVVLVRRTGMGHGARLASAAVFVAGFPMVFLAGQGYWPGMLAMGGLPWALAAIVSPAPAGILGWIGRLARIGLTTAWSAMFAPVLILVPLFFGIVWALATRVHTGLVTALVGSLSALPVLLPWAITRDPAGLVGGGVPFHLEPAWWAWVPALVAGLASVFSGRGRPMTVAATGLMIGSAGFLVARAGNLGAGRELTTAGVLITGLGMALIVAGALDGPSTLEEAGFPRRVLARVGMGAAVLVGLSTLVALPAGRLGLPDDRFDVLAFAESRAQAHGPDRILLAGPGDTLPGESRRLPDGTAYRLVAGVLDYPQAWLPQPLEGDAALEATLEGLLAREELRPGELLAPYGIRWVILTDRTRLNETLLAQLDLRPLSGLFVSESGGAWENQADAYRAVTSLGVPWSWVAPDYRGRPYGSTVRVSENADPRWGPGTWEEEGWANRLAARSGTAVFGGVESHRRLAQAAGVWVVVLFVLALSCRATRAGDGSA